jgi:hypothetical protein
VADHQAIAMKDNCLTRQEVETTKQKGKRRENSTYLARGIFCNKGSKALHKQKSFESVTTIKARMEICLFDSAISPTKTSKKITYSPKITSSIIYSIGICGLLEV